jgi:putative ABC transport system permease protein
MLSIVIGVTATVGVGLGTATTRSAYKQMFALVTGRATLEISGQGGKAFSGAILAEVERVAGVVAAAPLLDRPTSVTLEPERRVRVQLLGIDPARDGKVRDYAIVEGRQVAAGDELCLERQFARYLGLKVGDTVRMLTPNARARTLPIVGLYEPRAGGALAQMAVVMMPLPQAQRYFNTRYIPRDGIDRIQIVTDPQVPLERVQAAIAALLPEGVEVHRPAGSTQLMQETLLSTEQGLRLTTLFSLLMAAFIILNTFLMNVSERRRHLSILRAIGALRRQIVLALLGESLLLGVVGTLLGMLSGVLTALVVTRSLADAFEVQLPQLREVITPWPFVRGTVFGLTMAVVGAWVPAMLAGRVSPLEGMNRIVPPPSRRLHGWFLGVGSVLAASGLGVILGSIFGWLPIDSATYAAPLFLIGVVLLDSVVLAPQASLATRLFAPLAPIEAKLALKQVLRHHTRSALTVGVLFIAGSTGIGMANSILDCVRDVDEWYDQAIVGDFFLRAMMPDMATGTSADLPEELGEELRRVPHLESLDGAAFVEAKVRPPGPGVGDELTVIVIARDYAPGHRPAFDLIAGDRAHVLARLQAGEVVIGSVLAQKLGLKVGDRLPLETSEGWRDVPICGIANEYMVGGLAVHMTRSQAARWLGVRGVDGYILKVQPGYRDQVRPLLETIARKYDVVLLSHSDIRQTVDQFVRGAQWSLWALVLMGFLVASFGVVNTLTMNVLEQTRELGLLRIVAMTRTQVRRTVLLQALILGTVGLPPGILLGVGVAYVLNLAMMPSFGHPVEFHVYPGLLAATGAGALAIVLVAAAIPARRACRIDVVQALHYE